MGLRQIIQRIRSWMLRVWNPPNNASDETKFDDATQSKVSNQPSNSTNKVEESRENNTGNKNSNFTEKPRERSNLKSKAPHEIPGKRRPGKRPKLSPTPDTKTKRSPASRPVLICRKSLGSLQWEVILSSEDECHIAEVRHNGEILHSLNGEYRLLSYSGQLTIILKNGNQNSFALLDDKPLIFKLRNNWSGDGHNVRHLAKGHSIVIAPNEWERLGHIPVEPESCTDARFMAHYFFRNDCESEDYQLGFQECSINSSSSYFELKGEQVYDDSADGNLFVGAVPELNTPKGIDWVRIGEEKRDGWGGKNFEPAKRTLAQVLGKRQGRFYIRVYDSEVKMLDSGEFRYLHDLKEIRIDGERYTPQNLLVPPSTGHPPTTVSFIGANGAKIRPILSSKITRVKLRENDLIAAPHPDGDRISCSLESDSGCVDIELNLPRIWWRTERDGEEFVEWHDTPLTMTRQEFRMRADANEAIRLRLPQRIESIHVGFDGELERVNYHNHKGKGCLLPLADFVDYSQIDQRLNSDTSFHVKFSGIELPIVRVSADPVPTIVSFICNPKIARTGERVTLNWETRNADDCSVTIDPNIGAVRSSGILGFVPLKTTVLMLKLSASDMDDVTKTIAVVVNSLPKPDTRPFARVRRMGGGWRRGKGFSHGELQAVGVTNRALLCLIPIDKHRRSTHSVNVNKLERLIDVN